MNRRLRQYWNFFKLLYKHHSKDWTDDWIGNYYDRRRKICNE